MAITFALSQKRIKPRSEIATNHIVSKRGNPSSGNVELETVFLSKKRVSLWKNIAAALLLALFVNIKVTTISPSRVRPASDKKCAG